MSQFKHSVCFLWFVVKISMTVILNSLSSGYYGEGLNAIIVFSACYLPDSSCADYHYIMENLFLCVSQSELTYSHF